MGQDTCFDVAAELDRVGVPLLRRLAGLQNPDGGFPETFLADESGCWTTAEFYAGLAAFPGHGEVVGAVVDGAEKYLLGVLQRQGDGGLPYYEQPSAAVPGHRTSLSVVDVTASFLQGWRALHPEETEVRGRVEGWLRGARAAGPGSAFGIRPGDGRPRTYSTTYALLALDPDASTRADAETLLRWQDPASGSWPFRPGMPPSCLGTALALLALDLHDALPEGARTAGEEWLLGRLEADEILDEDSFLVPEGYNLTFVYSPFLVAAAELLRCAAVRVREGAPVENLRPFLGRVALCLARRLRTMRRTGRPNPTLPDDRVWHYMELVYGWSGIVEAREQLRPDVRGAFDDGYATAGLEIAGWSLSRELPLPLRHEVRVVTSARERPGHRARAVATHMEQVHAFAEALLFSHLRLYGAPGREALKRRLLARPKGASDFWTTRKAFQRVRGSAETDAAGLADRLVAEFRDVRSVQPLAKAWDRVHAARNQASHGAPVQKVREAEALCNEWVRLLDRMPALLDLRLVELERLSHEAGTGEHLYQWAEVDDRSRMGTVRTRQTIPDVWRVDERELRGVFVLDGKVSTMNPVSLLPFVALGRCDWCGTERMFVYHRHRVSAEKGATPRAVLTLRCVEQCGALLELPVGWDVLLGEGED